MLYPLLRDSVAFEVNTSVESESWLVEMDVDQFETTLVNLAVNAKDAAAATASGDGAFGFLTMLLLCFSRVRFSWPVRLRLR